MWNVKRNLLFVPVLILIANICSAVTASSQEPNKNLENSKPNPRISYESQQEEAMRQRERALRSVGASINRREEIPPVKISPEEAARRREEMENWNKTKQMLRPPNAYYERFAELLKNENIHLARIFVEKNCGEGKSVSVEELERCDGVPPVKGGGSFYSFRLRENYVFGRDWWDIHYTGNRLAVGNDSVQTIIADIGAIHLSDVNLKNKAFEFLKNYKPVQSLAEIKEKYKILEKGVVFNDYTYSNSAAVNFDSTYILRSIAYRLNEEPLRTNLGRGIDLFVAFKIVGRERDGSLVILWKQLKTELPRRELK